MAKLDPANLAPDALPRFRGNVIAYQNQHGTILQKWPRRRGPPQDWKTQFLSWQFGQSASEADPLAYETAKFLSQGTVWLPRDILVMASYGKLYEMVDPAHTWTQADHSAPIAGPKQETWSTVAQRTLNLNTGTLAAFTMRQRVASSVITKSAGSATRFNFIASTATSGLTIIKAYVQTAAATGDLWDFASPPVPLTFNGQPGTVIPISGSKMSDPVAWAPEWGRSLVVSYYCAANSRLRYVNTGQGWTNWYKLGDDATTVNATGYTLNAPAAGLSQIDMLGL